MKRIMCMLLGWMIPVAALAEVDESKDGPKKEPADKSEAIRILKRADQAIKAVKTISYKAVLQPSGWVSDALPPMTGTAILGGDIIKQRFRTFRFDIQVRLPDRQAALRFTMGGDGEKFFLLDPQRGVAHEGTAPTVVGFADPWVSHFGMAEFIHPTPFDQEINAEKVELIGTEKVGDEECDVIHVVYSTARGTESDWYFSKKDFLPRRVDRIVIDPDLGKGVATLVLTDLVVNPKTDENTFKLVLPEGFTKTKSIPVRVPE